MGVHVVWEKDHDPPILCATGAKPAPVEEQKEIEVTTNHLTNLQHTHTDIPFEILPSYWKLEGYLWLYNLCINEFVGCWSNNALPLANSASKRELSCTCMTNYILPTSKVL